MFNHERLRVYVRALELAKRVPGLVARWPRKFGDLEDQLKRAMISIILNTAEGNGRRSSKERARFFEIARSSANECAAVIDIARALKLSDEAECAYFKDELLQIFKILYKLP